MYGMRFWREGDLICISSENKNGRGLVTKCIFHAGDDYVFPRGPVIRFPLLDLSKMPPIVESAPTGTEEVPKPAQCCENPRIIELHTAEKDADGMAFMVRKCKNCSTRISQGLEKKEASQ